MHQNGISFDSNASLSGGISVFLSRFFCVFPEIRSVLMARQRMAEADAWHAVEHPCISEKKCSNWFGHKFLDPNFLHFKWSQKFLSAEKEELVWKSRIWRHGRQIVIARQVGHH